MNFNRPKREEISVNLTPLIDVVFLLLIFFMVSTTFTKETQLNINLPEADANPNDNQANRIEISISAEGNYAINTKALVNQQKATLIRAINEISQGNTDLLFTITADAKTPHQSVVRAMDVAGNLGFSKLSITTKESAEDNN